MAKYQLQRHSFLLFIGLCLGFVESRVRIGTEVALDPPVTQDFLSGNAPYCFNPGNVPDADEDDEDAPLTYVELHFAELHIPDACSLILSDPNGDEAETYPKSEDEGNDFWTLAVFDTTVCLSMICSEPGQVLFSIDQAIVGTHHASLANLERQRQMQQDLTPDASNFLRKREVDDGNYNNDRDLAVCGDGDFERATSYQSSSASRQQMYQTSQAVAYLIVGPWQCTGFLIGPHMMLTAKHCFSDSDGEDYDPNAIYQTTATFRLERSGMSQAERNANSYKADRVEAFPSDNRDWIAFSLRPDSSKGVPGSRFGYLQVERGFMSVNTPIFIPQHPMGRLKEITSRDRSPRGGNTNCRINNRWSNDRYYYYCDTQGGSSGSPVIDARTHRVLAVHTAASGCNSWGNTGLATSSFDEFLPAPRIPPTDAPTSHPTTSPTSAPTSEPTGSPTFVPTTSPTSPPTSHPTVSPTDTPTRSPSNMDPPPTEEPTSFPTRNPTSFPTDEPTDQPTSMPTDQPTSSPTDQPTSAPTIQTDYPTPAFVCEDNDDWNGPFGITCSSPWACFVPSNECPVTCDTCP